MSVVKTVEKEYQFFSVKKPVSFGGKTYRPSICYRISSDILGTVLALQEAGDAALYENAVRFVSGKIREDSGQSAVVAPVLVSPALEVSVGKDSGQDTPAATQTSRKRSSSASSGEVAGEFKDQGEK